MAEEDPIKEEEEEEELVVHCETNLLLNIFRTEQSDLRIPKAYSYLGVSKLSSPCHGCDSFIKGFNYVHGTRFMTKGCSHGRRKSYYYYLWQFPPENFSKKQDVIEATYKLIADSWVKTYNGYRPEFVADSTAQSSGRATVQCDFFGDPDQEKDLAEAAARYKKM